MIDGTVIRVAEGREPFFDNWYCVVITCGNSRQINLFKRFTILDDGAYSRLKNVLLRETDTAIHSFLDPIDDGFMLG